MSKCARCGAVEAGPPAWNRHGEYDYCDDCNETFLDAKENGVTVRSRHTNRAFREFPYEVSCTVEGVELPASDPKNQTEALAMGKYLMDRYDIPGLFVYQKTGSLWLIEEYLETHPGIADDVEKEINQMGKADGGFLSRFF